MKTIFGLFSAVVAVGSCSGNASDGSAGEAAPAVSQAPRSQAPRYDPSNEAMVSGKVTAVRAIEHGDPGGVGVHLDLESATQSYDVHLGPRDYLEEIGLQPAEGDELVIIGSLQEATPLVLIAREVRRGGQAFVLRDPDGRPLWRGRGRRAS